jgi:hypothetical protein
MSMTILEYTKNSARYRPIQLRLLFTKMCRIAIVFPDYIRLHVFREGLNRLSETVIKKYRAAAVSLFVLNVVSALLFILFVNHPAYDDSHHMPDVQRYASEGVSVSSIRTHINAPGPTAYIWMAMAARMFPGNELRSARVAILVSWLLLGAGIVIAAPYTRFPSLWYAAIFVTLAFPHAVSATALVLTEGPALLFATLGALLWVELLSLPTLSLYHGALGIVGSVSIGLAITCRQYYLALIPAALFFALLQLRKRSTPARSDWVLPVILSLVAGILPVLLLVAVWKGVLSPNVVSSSSYPNWISAVGGTFYRPIVTIFYIALYSLPLTFPAMRHLPPEQRWRALSVAVLGGFAAAHFMFALLKPGPFHSALGILSSTPIVQSLFFAMIVGATIYNLVAVVLLVWKKRIILFSCPPVVFSILAIAFFVVEQFGVPSNFPFYERYLLQLAPFLGIVAFAAMPMLTMPRLLVLGASSALGQFMLWRHALGR